MQYVVKWLSFVSQLKTCFYFLKQVLFCNFSKCYKFKLQLIFNFFLHEIYSFKVVINIFKLLLHFIFICLSIKPFLLKFFSLYKTKFQNQYQMLYSNFIIILSIQSNAENMEKLRNFFLNFSQLFNFGSCNSPTRGNCHE